MSTLQDQKQKVEAEIQKLEEMGGSISDHAKRLRDSTFSRFPFVFTFLTTFGLVATLYGFEKVIDQIAFFKDNPITVLIAGIATLTLTGTLYKKLS